MKKLLSVLLLFLSVKGICQFPVNSTNGTATTTNLTRGIAAADSAFQYRTYFLDTASANRGRIDEVPGVMIRTAPNVIWLRNSTATAWIRQANINDIINIVGCYTLINGGIVTWSGTGLTMDVTLANYIIGCRFFTSPVSQVTLAGADVTNPRIDVIAVDTNNAVVVITGTPAANPVKPQVNTSSQLELTQILVPANATTPGGITQTIVYDENEGTPDEWDATFQAVNGTVNFASTSIPFHLTIDAVPSTDAEGLMLFTAAAPVSMTDYSVVKLYIYNGSSYGQADDIQISLYRSGNPVTGALSAESYGYSHAVAGSYQIVTIPMSVFITGATNDLNQFDAIGIRIYESNSVNNLHFDYIQLQGGIPTGNSPYITNIFRIPGVDSFYFTRNGINYPIKDSIGSGGGSSYTFPYSVVAPGNAIQLENDTTANPANYFYGRNSAGRRGWYPQSGIVGATPTLQQVLTAGSTLTTNHTINAGNNTLKFILDEDQDHSGFEGLNYGGFIGFENGNGQIKIGTGSNVGGLNFANGLNQLYSSSATKNTAIQTFPDSIILNTQDGFIKVPFLNSTTDTTGKSLVIRNLTTGLLENIDPALIGGGITGTTDNALVVSGSDLNTNKTFAAITYSTTPVWDMTTGFNKFLTLTGDADLTVSNLQSGDVGSILFIQDGSGGHNVTVPNSSFEINQAAGDTTVASFLYDGTKLTWAVLQNGGGGSGTVSRVAPLDSLSRVANGIQIAGDAIVPGTADATHPGFIGLEDQTIGNGVKTFSRYVISDTLYGGTGSAGNIYYGSTTNATKGNHIWGTNSKMVFEEANNILRVGSSASVGSFNIQSIGPISVGRGSATPISSFTFSNNTTGSAGLGIYTSTDAMKGLFRANGPSIGGTFAGITKNNAAEVYSLDGPLHLYGSTGVYLMPNGTTPALTALTSGRIGLNGITAPTAWLHLPAGTATASTAPLKFTSGTNLTTPEAGSMEYDGSNFYLNPSTTRKRIPLYTSATPTAGSILYGNGTDWTLLAPGTAAQHLTGGSTPSWKDTATGGDITSATVNTSSTSATTIVTYSPTLTERGVMEITLTGLVAGGNDGTVGKKLVAYKRVAAGTVSIISITDVLTTASDNASTWTATVSGTDILVQVTSGVSTSTDWNVKYITTKTVIIP